MERSMDWLEKNKNIIHKTFIQYILIQAYYISATIVFFDLLLIETNKYKIQRNKLESRKCFINDN